MGRMIIIMKMVKVKQLLAIPTKVISRGERNDL